MKSAARRTHQAKRENVRRRLASLLEVDPDTLDPETLEQLQRLNESVGVVLADARLHTIQLSLYDIATLDDETARFLAQLDLIQRQIRESPELRAEFERHSLARLARARKAPLDQVAVEIAAEVTMMWSDRKQAPYKDQHWAWLKRPDLFVVHVYNRWIQKGVLRLEHLAYDEQLLDAYRTAVRRHPERDIFPNAKPASSRRSRRRSGPGTAADC